MSKERLKVIHLPDPRLNMKSEIVNDINEDIINLIDNMIYTMHEENGIGLAAVQVGILKRIIVIDLQDESDIFPIVMINPEVIYKSTNINVFEEGCLSVPKKLISVCRPEEIIVEYLDIGGKVQKIKTDGLFATCIQHEIDHLNGITIENYL